jgi:iron complex transport system ATP-binding protein
MSFKGSEIQTWSLRALSRVRAVLPQSSEVAFGLMANLVIGLGRIAIADDVKRDAIIRHAARLSSCEHLLYRSFDTLSGGEKARIHLARVFAQLWDEQE